MKRLLRLTMGGIAAALGIAGSTDAVARTSRSVSPERAPTAWIAYAQRASEVVRTGIESDEAQAVRFKAYLDAVRQQSGQPPAALALKLWIDRKGAITRVEFAPFADAQANADLTGLLVGRQVGSAPPRKMLLPLRLSIGLETPAAAGASAPNASTAIQP